MTRRVLIDECLPVQLHRWLRGFDVRTVEFMGWKGRRDDDLLRATRGRFDVSLTCDGFLPHEHDSADHGLAIVVLTTNRIREVERSVPDIAVALASEHLVVLASRATSS